MTKPNKTSGVRRAVLRLGISALIACRIVGSANAQTENKKNGPASVPTTAGQQPPRGGVQPAKRNAAIVDLEKKIAGQENKPAEQVFKNIQMFKGEPAQRVLRAMELGFTPALGVKCVFCHVPNQWDKDDKKHKLVARKMMTFTQMVNREVRKITDEKAAVSCYTCHRGQEKPALSPQPLNPPTPEHHHE